ncbi:MAG: LIC11966 family surface protein [Bacteroidales bacterium]|jgi:hypothetical protein|nr:hypothetical protein [Bacteroidales bacterium]
MRELNRVFLVVIISLTTFLTACKPSEKEIIRYNDEIVELQYGMLYAEAELINAISIGDTNLILITYNDLLYQIEKSIQNIELIEEIDEETSLKKIAAEMFYLYKTIYENEYNEIIRICFIPDEEYTPADDSLFYLIATEADMILNEINLEFFNTQKKLSEKYNVAFKSFDNVQ